MDKLPKESREKLKELVQLYLDQNLPKLSAFLGENTLSMGGPKLFLNKKSEKSFSLAQKFYTEEKIKDEENLTTVVCLFVSQILLGMGLFIWPCSRTIEPKKSLYILNSVLGSVKHKIDQSKIKELETLIELGLKNNQSRLEVSEAKSLLKGLSKLI